MNQRIHDTQNETSCPRSRDHLREFYSSRRDTAMAQVLAAINCDEWNQETRTDAEMLADVVVGIDNILTSLDRGESA